MTEKQDLVPVEVPSVPEDDGTTMEGLEASPQASPVGTLPAVEGDSVPFDWTEASPQAGVDETVGDLGRRRSPRQHSTDRRKTVRSAKAHLFVTVSHWSMVVLLALSLLSGMRLGWGYLDSPLRGWSGVIGAIAPKGSLLGVDLITLHVVLSFFMLGIVGIYVSYLSWSGSWRRLRVTRQDFSKLGTGLGNFWRNKRALWSSNLLVYWLGFVFIFVLLVTGVALYRVDLGLEQALGGYDLMRLLHGFVAYMWLPYVILHMVLQWLFGRFWTIFKAQVYGPHIRAGLIGIAITLPVVIGYYAWDSAPTTLTAIRLPEGAQAPVLDGDASDPVWSQTKAVTIRTVKGPNNAEDHVDVTVKALHDGEQIYFQFQWLDPDASYKRFPLIKTAGGWKVLQTAKENSDETVYYEDKLSTYITDVPNGSCAATCHVGAGPHAAAGDKHGLHYTDGEVGDVWHWKSVRTNYMHLRTTEPGYMDDQHFRGPDLPIPTDLKKRYSAGYHADPKTGGGYRYNYKKLDPDKPLAETFVRPLMLPLVHDLRPNAEPTTSDHKSTWWLHEATSIPYTEEADIFPEGTLLQNIIIEPFQGDRAHVRAKGAWRDGVWTLEVRRILDTKSEYDVAFIPGEPLYLSVAAYNRAQTRHSEHIKPVQLLLQK